MASAQQPLEQWTPARGADQAIDSGREDGRRRLVDEYFTLVDSFCVKPQGGELLPQLDLECLQEKRDVLDQQKMAAFNKQADEVIKTIPEILNKAIAGDKGHESIAITKLSLGTLIKLGEVLRADRFNRYYRGEVQEVIDQPEYLKLLNPAEKRVFDYLASQGLEPRLTLGRSEPTLDARLPEMGTGRKEGVPSNKPQGNDRRPPSSSEDARSRESNTVEYPGLYSTPPAH